MMRLLVWYCATFLISSAFASLGIEEVENLTIDESPANLSLNGSRELSHPVDADDEHNNNTDCIDSFPDSDRNESSHVNLSSSKRLWGSGTSSSSDTMAAFAQGQPDSTESLPPDSVPPSLPFMKKPKGPHGPPEGFVISARVYIDPDDGLAHLDEENKIVLPYWDCGVTGSTTSPIPVKDAAFRHSLTPTTPWTGTDGKHPLLAVALTPFFIETNSGESKSIRAGQVVLLEDVLMAGHRFLPVQHHELQVLFLTLPQTHYHAGKDRFSLNTGTNIRSSIHPCSLQDPTLRDPFLTAAVIRRSILGIFGFSLSALAVDFFGKTAPLWLAVGVGGTFFVASVTYLTVLAGDLALTNLEVWLEQRRLATHAGPKGGVSEEEKDVPKNSESTTEN